MDSNAERLARMQHTIARQIEEVERLQNRPAWLPIVGTFATFGAAAILVVLANHLL
jgi:hypothetical protein